MTTTLKEGIVYFLREKDLVERKFTGFCKIGLVAGDRDTQQRIKEHQTGNPREIVEVASIPTNAVTRLESYLHNKYATKRVMGEWFSLDESEVESAVEVAAQKAASLSEAEDSLLQSRQFQNVVSSSASRVPTNLEEELHGSLVDKLSTLAEKKAEQSLVKMKLQKIMGSFAGISGLLAAKQVAPRTVFSIAEFKSDHPELYAQFLKARPDRVKGRFTIIGNPTRKDLPTKLREDLKALKSQVDESKVNLDSGALEEFTDEAIDLHSLFFELSSELADLELEVELMTAKLKALCAESAGIDGICHWERELVAQPAEFDAKSFRLAHGDLYNTYLQQKSSHLRVTMITNFGLEHDL